MNKKNRLLELFKSVLIVALTGSAIWLAMQTQLAKPMGGLVPTQPGLTATPAEERAHLAAPLSIVATLPGDTQVLRYSAQYDRLAAEALFQQVASLLVEALPSAGQPQLISRSQWERALGAAPGVFLDFRGNMPLPVLALWLSGERTGLTASVRRLALAADGESVALYYQADGSYYRCLSSVVTPRQLEDALTGLVENGAFFAYESPTYHMLDQNTLLTQETVPYGVYAASNPMSGGQAALETLMDELGYHITPGSSYLASEWVARSGNDAVRLSAQGVAVFRAGEEGSAHFSTSGQLGDSELLQAAQLCRELVTTILAPRCGEAQLYLQQVQSIAEGWQIDFGYCINGLPVLLREGYAARFVGKNDAITQFTLNFRSFARTEQTAPVVPSLQAAAALEAMGQEGEELALVYRDAGDETVCVDWVAVTRTE
jgi:hypothetical protein